MKIVMFTAVALSVFSTAVLANNRPSWDPQAGSPMDFIVHDQPAKYPDAGARADRAGVRPAPNALQGVRAQSPAEQAWTDRASQASGGK